MFKLHPKLVCDNHFVADLKLSRLLLAKDSNYLWLILVPRVPGAIEITDLEFKIQQQLLLEINIIGKIIKKDFNYQKLNIASLGNVVSQLHIHLIGRNQDDASFPKPIWGQVRPKEYQLGKANQIIARIRNLICEIN